MASQLVYNVLERYDSTEFWFKKIIDSIQSDFIETYLNNSVDSQKTHTDTKKHEFFNEDLLSNSST